MIKNMMTNALLVILSIFVGILLFELLSGLFLNRPLLLMGFHAIPNKPVSGIEINNQGFAGDDIQIPKRNNTHRILVLGGSSVFNLSFAERLKTNISSQSESPIELESGALRAYTSASSLIQWKYYFYRYQFDTVFIYHGINELWMNRVKPEDFRRDYSHVHHAYKRNFILDHCLSCRFAYSLYNPPAAERTELPAGYISEATYENNIRELVNQIRAQGARPVLITMAFYIPDGYTDEKFRQLQAGYSAQIDFSGDWWPISLWGTPDYVRNGIQRNNNIIRRVSSEMQVDLIDLETTIDAQPSQKPSLFGDICHFSDAGVDRFIEILTEWYIQNTHTVSNNS